MRAARGGKLYNSKWGQRMRGGGQYADMLAQRFNAARRKFGLGKRRLDLDPPQFRRPSQAGEQLRLL